MDKQQFRSTALNVAFFSTISYGVDYSFQLVDIYWVAQIGVGAATAIAVVSSILYLVLSANEIVGVSSVAIISQCVGRGDHEKTGHAILQTLALKLVLGILSAILFVGAMVFLVRYYDLNAIERQYVSDYGNIIWISLVLVPVYSSMMTALRALNQASLTSLISLAALVLNAVINPILIFGWGPVPAYGITGAAWATIIAQLFAIACCIYALLRNKAGIPIFCRRHLTWSTATYRDLLLIGLPVAGVMVLYNTEQTILTALVANFQSTVSDGYGIGARINGMLYMIIFGISLGMSVAVGQALGMRQADIVWQGMKSVISIVMAIMFVVSCLLFLCAEPLATAFTGEPQSVETAGLFLRYMAVANLGLALLYCFNGVYEGAGRNLPSLRAAIIMYVLFEFPLLAGYWYFDSMSLAWLWFILTAAAWLGACVMAVTYRGGSWVSPTQS